MPVINTYLVNKEIEMLIVDFVSNRIEWFFFLDILYQSISNNKFNFYVFFFKFFADEQGEQDQQDEHVYGMPWHCNERSKRHSRSTQLLQWLRSVIAHNVRK